MLFPQASRRRDAPYGTLEPRLWACRTGWFDHETDGDATSTAECFAEHFLRNNTGGAVAILGSTRNSFPHNDFMKLGAFEAIWPEFAPDPPFTGPGGITVLPGVESGPLLRMGQIHTFAKTYMSRVYDHDIDNYQNINQGLIRVEINFVKKRTQ